MSLSWPYCVQVQWICSQQSTSLQSAFVESLLVESASAVVTGLQLLSAVQKLKGALRWQCWHVSRPTRSPLSNQVDHTPYFCSIDGGRRDYCWARNWEFWRQQTHTDSNYWIKDWAKFYKLCLSITSSMWVLFSLGLVGRLAQHTRASISSKNVCFLIYIYWEFYSFYVS